MLPTLTASVFPTAFRIRSQLLRRVEKPLPLTSLASFVVISFQEFSRNSKFTVGPPKPCYFILSDFEEVSCKVLSPSCFPHGKLQFIPQTQFHVPFPYWVFLDPPFLIDNHFILWATSGPCVCIY